MTPRSFFTLLLKILGLYLLFDLLIIVPDLITTLSSFSVSFLAPDNNMGVILLTASLVLLTAAIYYFVLRFCLFNPDWIIDKLKLDTGFQEEKFELNVHRSTVLSIATIVTGALIFIDGLPHFCSELWGVVGYIQTSLHYNQAPKTGWMFFYLVKIFMGYFLMVNNRLVVNYIERRRQT